MGYYGVLADGNTLREAVIILRRRGLDWTIQDIIDWMAGGEVVERITAEDLAEQILEWNGEA